MGVRTPNSLSLKEAYEIMEVIVDRAYDSRESMGERDSVEREALFTIRDFVGDLLEKMEGG